MVVGVGDESANAPSSTQPSPSNLPDRWNPMGGEPVKPTHGDPEVSHGTARLDVGAPFNLRTQPELLALPFGLGADAPVSVRRSPST